MFANLKLIVAGLVLVAFLCLGAAYKIKSSQLDAARAALATEQANNAALSATVEVQRQNQGQVKASQDRQQERQIQVGEIRERIIEVKTSELTPIEIGLCALITKLYNGLLVKKTRRGSPTEGVLSPSGERAITGAEGH